MTAKEAVKLAKKKAVEPYTEVLSVSETVEYYIVEFTDKGHTELTGDENTLFAVTKKTGDVWSMYLPDKRNFEILRRAKEVRI